MRRQCAAAKSKSVDYSTVGRFIRLQLTSSGTQVRRRRWRCELIWVQRHDRACRVELARWSMAGASVHDRASSIPTVRLPMARLILHLAYEQRTTPEVCDQLGGRASFQRADKMCLHSAQASWHGGAHLNWTGRSRCSLRVALLSCRYAVHVQHVS